MAVTRKPQVFGLFVSLAAASLAGTVAFQLVIPSATLGWSVDAVAAIAIAFLGVGCFSPNSALFGPVITGRGVTAPVMALTFDDGPSPDTTPRILDALREAGVRATFFVLGKHAAQHPELVARIAREGHEVANHGWSHGLLVFCTPAAIKRELAETAALLTRCGAPPPTLFRAPHGFKSPFLSRVARRLGYQVVGWTKGVYDTALPGAAVIAERSRESMRAGAILLLHDADGNGNGDRSQTADALPEVLRDVRAAGLAPVTVSELVALGSESQRSRTRVLAVAAALAVLGAVIIDRVGLDSLRSAAGVFAGVNLAFVVAAILANVISVALKATVWKATLDRVPSRPPVRYRQVLAAVFVGFLLNSVMVARVGELGRVLVLRRRIARDSGVNVPAGTIAGTVVSENIVLGATLVALLTLMTFAVTTLPPMVMSGIRIMLAGVIALVLAGVGIEMVSRWRLRRSAQWPAHPTWLHWRWLAHHAERLVHQLSEGQRVFTSFSSATLVIAAGLVSWLANLVAIWLTLLAFGIEGNAFAAAVVVFAVSNLVGIVQVTPGNVGVFQAAIVVALTQSYGVDRSLALSFGVGLQAIEVGLGGGLGAIFLAMEGLTLAEVRKEMKSGGSAAVDAR